MGVHLGVGVGGTASVVTVQAHERVTVAVVVAAPAQTMLTNEAWWSLL